MAHSTQAPCARGCDLGSPGTVTVDMQMQCSNPHLFPSRESRLCSTYIGFTVSPTTMSPVSGFSWPRIILKRVLFPAPLPPQIPITAPGGTSNERSLMSRRSPNALLNPLTCGTPMRVD